VSDKRLARALEELQAAQAELESERLRSRDLFELAPDAYLLTDPEGTILEANRAAEALFQAPKATLRASTLADLLASAERPAFQRMLARMQSLELLSDWELQLCRHNDTVFTGAVTVGWLASRDGGKAELRWVIRDVSERRAYEERMVAANIDLDRRVGERTEQLESLGREKDEAFARLEAVLDQIPAAIVIADAASGKIVAANEHAARLVAEVAGAGDTLARWLSIGFHPGGTPYLTEERPIMRALADGESIKPQEIEFLRLDGTRALYETGAAPIRNTDGEVVAAVAVYWDLTARIRLARAEREFVTNAAHELRTPLAALVSAVEVLQAGAKDDPRQRDRFLTHVEQQSARLQRLVRALLQLARLQTLQEKAEREPVPVRSLLEAVAELGPSDRIRVEVDGAASTSVLANRDLAEQALLNLVANAAKYAPEGEIVLRSESVNGYVALEVADSGPGMTSAETARATDRFYRARDDEEGFGLGLSIARQAAEALDGRLELESDRGGTRARLLLPLAASDA